MARRPRDRPSASRRGRSSVTPQGVPVEGMFVVLSGRIAIFVDRGAGPHKIAEWQGGRRHGPAAVLPPGLPPGRSVAQEPAEILAVPREQLGAMIRECHEITSILVHSMVDRARVFTSSDLHDEKMVSLGKLSAGLAHELNNPASAIERSAALLEEPARGRRAGDARARRGQADRCPARRRRCACASPAWPRASTACGRRSSRPSARRPSPTGSPITAWTSRIAEALAETAVTFEALDQLAAAVDGPALNAVLRWAAAGCSVRGLASEIQEAAMRISGLVAGDQGLHAHGPGDGGRAGGPGAEPGNTVAVLKSKARAKSVAVVGGSGSRPAARRAASPANSTRSGRT